jgi:hypothetical protein
VIPLILVLVLAVVLFGAGAAFEFLKLVAVIVAAVWLLGFLVRPTRAGTRGRWYYW